MTSDNPLEVHKELKGKITVKGKRDIKSLADLAILYTPGVAEPCKLIAKDKKLVYEYTMKGNTVAIVSDGTRVLGLDEISADLFEPSLRKGFGRRLAQREVMSHLELLAVCGDVAWVEPEKFTSRATGSSGYLEFFAKYI